MRRRSILSFPCRVLRLLLLLLELIRLSRISGSRGHGFIGSDSTFEHLSHDAVFQAF